jgi:hypothetical protein
MPKQSARASAPVGHDDVVHLVGDLDNTVIIAILGTRATYGEIEEAVRWATGDAEQLGKMGHPLSPAAASVYDILVADPSFEPEAEP